MSWDGAGLSTWGRGLAWMAGVEILPARSVGKGGPAAGWWRGRGATCGFPLHHSLRERSPSPSVMGRNWMFPYMSPSPLPGALGALWSRRNYFGEIMTPPWLLPAFVLLVGYLLGSIPFGLLLTRFTGAGEDRTSVV